MPEVLAGEPPSLGSTSGVVDGEGAHARMRQVFRRRRQWMRRKAALADGTTIGMAVCDEDSVCAVVVESQARRGSWTVRPGRRAIDAWPVAQVALLRGLCGSTLVGAGARMGRTASNAWVLEERHRRWVRDDESYATRVAELAREALARCHPGVVVAE